MTMTLPIVAVFGPTCVGKTKLGISIAKAANGEIVSLDSIQVYKDNKIMAGLVTPEEKQGIKHHLVDYLEAPDEPNDFVPSAIEAIQLISQRGKLPVVVGGSMSLAEPLFSHHFMDDYDAFVVMLKPRITDLVIHTDARVDSMICQGLLQEVQKLYELEKIYQPGDYASQGVWKSIGYPELRHCCELPELSIESALFAFGVESMKLNTRSYARQQLNWMVDRLLPILLRRQWGIWIINVNFIQGFEDEVERPVLGQVKNWLAGHDHCKWVSAHQFGGKHLLDDEF